MECTHCPWDLIEFYFRMGLRYKDIKSVLGSGHLTSEKMTQRDGTFCRKGNADLEVLISQKCLLFILLLFNYLVFFKFCYTFTSYLCNAAVFCQMLLTLLCGTTLKIGV